VDYIYLIIYFFVFVAFVFGMKGEEQKKLDVLSNEVFIKALVSSGRTVSDYVIFFLYLFWGSEEGSALQHQGFGIFYFVMILFAHNFTQQKHDFNLKFWFILRF